MKQVTINLYKIDELSEIAKDNAIWEHELFLMMKGIEIEDENGEMVTVPYEPTENEVIESIETNNHLFYADGKMANITNYFGKHEKAGLSELKIGEDIYNL